MASCGSVGCRNHRNSKYHGQAKHTCHHNFAHTTYRTTTEFVLLLIVHIFLLVRFFSVAGVKLLGNSFNSIIITLFSIFNAQILPGLPAPAIYFPHFPDPPPWHKLPIRPVDNAYSPANPCQGATPYAAPANIFLQHPTPDKQKNRHIFNYYCRLQKK